MSAVQQSKRKFLSLEMKRLAMQRTDNMRHYQKVALDFEVGEVTISDW